MSEPARAPVVVVVGAGPGVGAAVARRFAQEGYAAGLVGRRASVLEEVSAGLVASGATTATSVAEVTDVAALTSAIHDLAERLGGLDVLHVNPSTYRAADPLRLTAAQLLDDVALGVAPLLTAVQAARPHLRPGGRVLVTGSGAADHPSYAAASLGVQKAAQRNLVRSLDDRLAPEGIRAVTLTVQGFLAEDGPFSPDRVAAALYDASRQPEGSWSSEVVYSG